MATPQLTADTFIAAAPKTLVLDGGFRFTRGHTIAPFTITYETFGALNADGSNAVLICHALSPSAHVAGKFSEEDEKPGWWDGLVGYGKGLDLNELFVICANIPGSCNGTTAPNSNNPQTGRPYGSAYPWVTVEDMVNVEHCVVQHLGIKRLRAVAGGSLGGMQVLMWAALYPEMMESIICMAAGSAVPVQSVAWHIIGRKIIESDVHFRHGDYYDDPHALRGLQVARMVGHLTYLSSEALERKFGRRRRHGTRQFEIDSYLEYQGKKFANSFDANSYIRLQAAMDEMDLEEQFGSLRAALERFRGTALLLAFDTDWLFPPAEMEKVHRALTENGLESRYQLFETSNGHDAFLIDYHLITPPVREFMAVKGKEKL